MAPAFTGRPSSTFLVFTPLRSLSLGPGRSSACLPWDSSGLGWFPARLAPLRGSRGPLKSPLRRFVRARPLPGALAGSLRPRRCYLRSPVPSSWSLTTSTASSARGLRACCVPLPTLGFIAFRPTRRLRSSLPSGRSRSRRAASPRCPFVPLEERSADEAPDAAAPRHRGRFLRGVRDALHTRFLGAPLRGRRLCALRPRRSPSRRCSSSGLRSAAIRLRRWCATSILPGLCSPSRPSSARRSRAGSLLQSALAGLSAVRSRSPPSPRGVGGKSIAEATDLVGGGRSRRSRRGSARRWTRSLPRLLTAHRWARAPLESVRTGMSRRFAARPVARSGGESRGPPWGW